jgi:hypothetical protein
MLTLKGLSTRKHALLTFQKGSRLYQTFLHDHDLTALTRCEGHELQDYAGSFRLPGATLSRHYDALIFVSVSQEPVRRAGDRVTATSNWDEFLRIVGGGVQTGSTRHRGHLLSYCACPG